MSLDLHMYIQNLYMHVCLHVVLFTYTVILPAPRMIMGSGTGITV